MNHYPESMQRLIGSFAKLPGVGKKTAERLALHLLRAPAQEARQLATSIMEMKERTRFCSMCFALADSGLCPTCADPSRDRSLLCVVETPADMLSIERSGAFTGLYHILQGAISPMDGIGPEEIRAAELFSRIPRDGVREVILATGTNVEGEATASYIARQLAGSPVKVTRIASGVPMGGDLKYVDQVTLKRAMESRNDI